MNALDLMRMQVDTLFTHDKHGRMVAVNELRGRAAPRFFLGRTAVGKVPRFRHDLDPDLVSALATVCAAERVDDECLVEPYGVTEFVATLARWRAVSRVWTGPAYRFPEELPLARDAVAVDEQNADRLLTHFPAWHGDTALQPFFAFLVDGDIVSLCCSVRASSRAHEAGVETAAGFRGRGYAVQVVTAWARAVRDRDRIPLYSTSWTNAASRALAAKLRLIRFGTDMHIT